MNRRMTTSLLVTVLLLVMGMESATAQSGRAACIEATERNKLERKYGYHNDQIGNELAPFSNHDRFDDIPTDQMIRSIAGYYCDSLSLLPIIYSTFHGVVVVGPGYERTFTVDKIDEAVRAWLKILTINGRFDKK
ncbi:MAG: hypothetical protein HN461_21670 [Rhodospirillaceae bacterium]|jgi:hypothetical protein|nr:hypothetical protein [Rhodospirillaceae bacterium]MBT3494909.1 hypothetical protein [Rhodospirillaceae bacterium]